MTRLQKSRAKNSEFAQFTSPDQLHTELVGAQDDYSPSNQRLGISSSFSSPLKSGVEVRRRPLGNLNNPKSREAMFSPDRPSRVDKWTNVINEAYEKNGLDSPLRSNSNKKKKPIKGGRAKNILDSFEISRTRSAQKKSDYEEALIGRSNEYYMKEATATTNNISVPQSPGYFEFDPTAVNHIRRTRISSQNLFTSEGNSYHFSSSSSSEEETSGDMNDTFDTEPRSNTKKSQQMKNRDESDESDTFHETKSRRQQQETIPRNFNYSKNRNNSIEAVNSIQQHASNDQSKQIPTQSLNKSPKEENCYSDWSVSNTNVTAEVEECIADIFSQEMAPDDIVQMYKKQISIPTDVLCKRKKRHSKLKKYTEKNVLEKYNKMRNISQSSCKDMTSSTLEVEECTLDILEQTMIGRDQVGEKYQKHIVSESTLEVEECTADVLEQTMATTVSETALEVEECTADVLEQTMTSETLGSNVSKSKHASDTTLEIEECIADVMEQTMASEVFVRKSSTRSSSRQVSFSGDEYQNTTEEISQCVEDVTNPSRTQSVSVSREISECVRDVNSPRNKHIESISSDLSTGLEKLEEIVSPGKKNRHDQKLRNSPTPSISTSTTMSNDAETSNSSNQELHALMEDFDQELKSAETTGSLSIGENETVRRREVSKEKDVLQSSVNLSKQERMEFLLDTMTECVAKYDFEEALYISRGIIQIQKSNYGENSVEVASAYCDIGEIHLQYSNFISDALQIKKQCQFSIDAFISASSIMRKCAGENHPWASMCLARVGLIYLKIQKHEEAIEVFEECLFLRRKFLGTKHPLVAKIQNNLGIAYLSQGSFRKALEAFECTYSIQRREIRKSDPNDESLTKRYTQLCDTLSNIGSLCLDWGEKRDIENEMRIKLADNAIKAFSEALRIYRGALEGFEQAKEELEQLRVEAEKMKKRHSPTRPPSPDISNEEPSDNKNTTDRSQTMYNLMKQDEENYVMPDADCISATWNSVCSLPFDEMSTYRGNKSNRNGSVASRIDTSSGMQEARTSLQKISTNFSVNFPDLENEFKSTMSIDEVLPSSFGKDSSVHSKSGTIAARLQEDMSKWMSNYSRSSSNKDVVNSSNANSSSKERSLSISGAPSINRRRFEKDNPISPFSSPRFPVSTIEWNPGNDTVYNSAEVSKSDIDTSHLNEELPGMFRNAKEFNSMSQRSELHFKGHDSMYSVGSTRVTDTTDDGLIMPTKNGEHLDQQEIDEGTIIKNPDLYEIEIYNRAASYLKVSCNFKLESN